MIDLDRHEWIPVTVRAGGRVSGITERDVLWRIAERVLVQQLLHGRGIFRERAERTA